MDFVLFGLENTLLVFGIICGLTGIIGYGRRSHDWKGVATMFYKRIPMSVAEYKWYRLGIAMMVLAIVLRIVRLIFWPA
ncbi:hypothetical protein [Vibrio sp.]|uniref:hypothetical protein n=1 Tax=Vibrio sp. TaxID=678 RepID=UPI003D0E2D6F